MPRLRRESDPWDRYRVLIIGTMDVLEIDTTELAARMGVSRQTMACKLARPESLRLGDMRKLHRVLGIKADDARAALPVV